MSAGKPVSSITRYVDGDVHFAFRDAFDSAHFVRLTQDQIDSYHKALGNFTTEAS